LRTKHLKLVGAAGAAALTVGGLTAPALAGVPANTADVHYTCATAAGNTTPEIQFGFNSAPASVVAGKTVKVPGTQTVTIDATTSGLAHTVFLWDSFKGTVKTTPTAKRAGLNIKIPKTTIPNQVDGTTVATTTGNVLVRAFKAGTYTMKLGSLGHVHLQGLDASGNPIPANSNGVADFPNADGSFGRCKNNAGSTTVKNAGTPVTIKVTKDKSTTAAKASYNAKKDKATGTAKVKGHFGLPGTGKVKLTLKKGTHTVKSMKVKLNKKGVATGAFKHVKAKGKYSISASFKGDAALKGSSDKAKFTVK
jgi:hypothetical protein